MPINLELLDEGRLLKLSIVAPWSMNELLEVFPFVEQHLDNSTFSVNTLSDLSKMGAAIPASMLRLRQSPFFTHPNCGYQLIVGANTYAKMLGDALFRLTGNKRVKFFATMDEAWTFLQTIELGLTE